MAYKILVVDDERDVVEIVQKRLIKEGYVVVAAFDGVEALEKVKAENPDLVILDLMMPKMNGFEVIKAIRENHKDKWRPIIVISAKNELESLKDCYKLEADHYLSKPSTIENILRGIETMISLIPLRKE